jgi:hypothetical protein
MRGRPSRKNRRTRVARWFVVSVVEQVGSDSAGAMDAMAQDFGSPLRTENKLDHPRARPEPELPKLSNGEHRHWKDQ